MSFFKFTISTSYHSKHNLLLCSVLFSVTFLSQTFPEKSITRAIIKDNNKKSELLNEALGYTGVDSRRSER